VSVIYFVIFCQSPCQSLVLPPRGLLFSPICQNKLSVIAHRLLLGSSAIHTITHIRVISEGSCDTEDWSNDAGNHRKKLHFNIYSHRKHLF